MPSSLMCFNSLEAKFSFFACSIFLQKACILTTETLRSLHYWVCWSLLWLVWQTAPLLLCAFVIVLFQWVPILWPSFYSPSRTKLFVGLNYSTDLNRCMVANISQRSTKICKRGYFGQVLEVFCSKICESWLFVSVLQSSEHMGDILAWFAFLCCNCWWGSLW